ncbi:proline-rich protein 36 [Triticum aestivum]|uniref:proline-rich protein 36 n=1 Tax=Triticum aestivum TaxID=4565 RepID=UPI001D01B1E4|nr:proline-rich protein 36-like [Triticum aestivum]
MRHALTFAEETGFQQIIVASGCANLVSKVKSGEKNRSHIVAIVFDIKRRVPKFMPWPLFALNKFLNAYTKLSFQPEPVPLEEKRTPLPPAPTPLHRDQLTTVAASFHRADSIPPPHADPYFPVLAVSLPRAPPLLPRIGHLPAPRASPSFPRADRLSPLCATLLLPPRRRSPYPFPDPPDDASFPDPAAPQHNRRRGWRPAPDSCAATALPPCAGSSTLQPQAVQSLRHGHALHLLLAASHPGVARALGSPPLRPAVQPGRPRPFTRRSSQADCVEPPSARTLGSHMRPLPQLVAENQ